MYEYRARCLRVVDGDTADLQVDLGFHLKADLRFRLKDVDTPELRGGTDESKEAAQKAKAFVHQLLVDDLRISVPWPLRIVTEKADSFGRWIATIYIKAHNHSPEVNLGEALLEAELAEPYSGRY